MVRYAGHIRSHRSEVRNFCATPMRGTSPRLHTRRRRNDDPDIRARAGITAPADRRFAAVAGA